CCSADASRAPRARDPHPAGDLRGALPLHLLAGADLPHRLPEGVRDPHGQHRGRAAGPGDRPGGYRPHGDGGVRRHRQFQAAVVVQAQPGAHGSAGGQDLRDHLFRPERQRQPDRRQRHAVGGAGARLGLLPEDRVLLLHRPDPAGGRGARHAGALHHRSVTARKRRHRDPVVHLLQERIRDGAAGRSVATRRRAAPGRALIHHHKQPERKPGTMAQAQAQHTPDQQAYYVPTHSKWPLFASVAFFTAMFGLANWFNDVSWGPTVFFVGAAGLALVLMKWFADVILESVSGYYNKQVDTSFRMGMIWFIFSEVMLFGAFFGALFYTRMLSVPWLGGEGVKGVATNTFLW